MKKDTVNKVEFNLYNGTQFNLALGNGTIYAEQNNRNKDIINRAKIKSRTQEYADKWNDNMFLNNFDERDENAGINVKLREVYLDKHLPHYIWGNNRNARDDLKTLLKEYINPHNGNKMLLILGQPGIGKSTLITWITANFTNKIDDILVYQFASDLKNVIWQNLGNDIKRSLLEELNILAEDLEGKILILDGFDELSVGKDRVQILNQIYWKLIKESSLNKFSLIITCRENYIDKLFKINCNYITLQSWNEEQINGFCKTFQEKTKHDISGYTIANILNNKEILGIPLILYMVLTLNISIEKDESIVDIYDRIFSLKDGGIYDRCIDNKNFAEPHRIGKIKTQIHQISREIAFWMFENKPDEAYIPQEEYEKICSDIMEEQAQENNELIQDFKIGSYFKLVKHCEGMETEELYFVHRSIYEYFVAEYIYGSIENAMKKQTDKSQEELAKNIVLYLKKGKITITIGEYLQYKIIKLYNRLDIEKKDKFYQWWECAVDKILTNGMFSFMKKNIRVYGDTVSMQFICFLNLLEILRLLLHICKEKYIGRYIGRYIEQEQLIRYVLHCTIEQKMNYINKKNIIDLSEVFLKDVDLNRVNLKKVNFSKADLRGANLRNTDLRGANFSDADLRGSDLEDADLEDADLKGAKFGVINLNDTNLRGAKLKNADLRGSDLESVDLDYTNLMGVILDETQLKYLKGKYNLQDTKVYVEKTGKTISYIEYCQKES